MIRSLNIRPDERYTPGRIAYHMVLATAPEPTLIRTKPRRSRWTWAAWLVLSPSIATGSLVTALWILRRGL